MSIQNMIKRITLFFILLLTNTLCLADSTISINTESGNSTLLVKNNRILIKANEPENTANIQGVNVSEAIFETNQQTLYLIDHDEQTVTTITKENIEQLSKTIDAAADVLDAIPSEHRGSLSNLMRGLGIEVPTNDSDASPEVTLNPLSEQQFRGISCQENSVLEDSQELARVCITQGNSTPLTNDDYQTLLSAQSYFLSLAKQAQPFAEQYGQSIPNLAGVELSGLVVYSNQTQVDPNTQAANFVISAVNTNDISEITLPENYQSRPLLFSD